MREKRAIQKEKGEREERLEYRDHENLEEGNERENGRKEQRKRHRERKKRQGLTGGQLTCMKVRNDARMTQASTKA